MDSVGEGGKMWENGIETCKIACMKQVASPGSMHDTGCLGLVHWDDPEKEKKKKKKDGNDNPVCDTAKETQMYRTVFWTLWERERVGRFGGMALKHV